VSSPAIAPSGSMVKVPTGIAGEVEARGREGNQGGWSESVNPVVVLASDANLPAQSDISISSFPITVCVFSSLSLFFPDVLLMLAAISERGTSLSSASTPARLGRVADDVGRRADSRDGSTPGTGWHARAEVGAVTAAAVAVHRPARMGSVEGELPRRGTMKSRRERRSRIFSMPVKRRIRHRALSTHSSWPCSRDRLPRQFVSSFPQQSPLST
jgi:hypothetical protein